MNLFQLFENFDRAFPDNYKKFLNLSDVFPGQLSVDIRNRPAGSFPKIDLAETETEIHCVVPLPGINKEEIFLSVQGNTLTIEGKRENPYNPEKVNLYRNERFYGQFKRVITLPETANPERVEAAFQDGLLLIRIEKQEQRKTRKIAIEG